jgi:hypothetical protein
VPTTPNVRPGFRSGGTFAVMVIANRNRSRTPAQIVMAISGLVVDRRATCRNRAVAAR